MQRRTRPSLHCGRASKSPRIYYAIVKQLFRKAYHQTLGCIGELCKKTTHGKTNDPKWSEKVETVSTYPPKDLYTKDAHTIARVMASKKVSPKGLGSAVRMIQFYINRVGAILSNSRVREPEHAKRILQERNTAGK